MAPSPERKPDSSSADAHQPTVAADSSRASRSAERFAPPAELGDYLLLEPIGQGGMGSVYRARHRHLGNDVAVKIVRPDNDDASSAERFQREMKAIGALKHPRIVRATDAGVAHGVQYLVMDLVPARDLADVVKSGGPLSEAEALRLTEQAAEALQYAHEQGVIHRDVKPSNLLLDASGMLHLADLGLARFAVAAEGSDVTGSRTMLGTVDYMAPEQAVNSKLADERSDIYSLGCTLFFLLAGRPPYQAETMMGRLIAHREEPLPSLSEQRPGLDPAVERLFRRMAAKRPEDRPASMGEVRAAIQQSLSRRTAEPARPNPRRSFLTRSLWLAGGAAAFWGGKAVWDGMFRPASPVVTPRRLEYRQGVADLLAFIRPELDAVQQPGKRQARFLGDVLFVPRNSHLVVPADAPENYELRFEIVRPPGELGGLSMVFRREESLIGLLLDEETTPDVVFSTLQPFQAEPETESPVYIAPSWIPEATALLPEGELREVRVQVRQEGVTVTVGGREVIAWRGDYKQFRAPRSLLAVVRSLALIGQSGGYEVHRAELRVLE